MTSRSRKTWNDRIHRIRKDPTEYLTITSPDLKSNIECVLAALHGSAALDDVELFERLLDDFFSKPNFIRVYLNRIESQLLGCLFREHYRKNDDEEWGKLKGVLFNRPQVFSFLPRWLQTNSLMIKAAIHNKLDDEELELILQDTPLDVFIDHPFLIVERVRRYQRLRVDPLIYWQRIPATLWQHQTVLQELMLSMGDIPRSTFPTHLCSNQQFFLGFFQNHSPIISPLDANILDFMDASLKADKGFVLECVRQDPFMLFHCAEELQSDLDIFLEAVEYNRLSQQFIADLGDRFDTFLKAILVTSLGIDFGAFLACSWKCGRDESMRHHALRLLDCGLETSTALKRLIHSYVVETETKVNRMASALEKVVSFVIESDIPTPKIFRSVPQDFLVRMMQGKLKRGTTWGNCAVHVRHVPSEFWQDRHFVLCWIKGFGQVHSLIPMEFNADVELCLAYYKVCAPNHLSHCLAWFSEGLMTDTSFLTQCALINPIILNHCSDDIRLDRSFLFDLASQLCATRCRRPFDNFVVAAVNGGWGMAFERLKEELWRKRVDCIAYHAFDKGIRASQLLTSVRPEDSTSILERIKDFVGVASDRRLWRPWSVINDRRLNIQSFA